MTKFVMKKSHDGGKMGHEERAFLEMVIFRHAQR